MSDSPAADLPTTGDGARRPSVLVLDVNETLSDMSPMAARFEDVGAPGSMARTWFAGILRDGFALAAAGTADSFARIAAESLRVGLHGLPLNRAPEDAVEHIMAGLGGLPVHPDVPAGVRALRESGIRLVTLTNGATAVADGLLERAGIRALVERLLSVDDAGVWKPARGSYAYALGQCGVEARDAMLVAVHPWDIDGAARAGLATAWVNRSGAPYPRYFTAADVEVSSFTELAGLLR